MSKRSDQPGLFDVELEPQDRRPASGSRLSEDGARLPDAGSQTPDVSARPPASTSAPEPAFENRAPDAGSRAPDSGGSTFQPSRSGPDDADAAARTFATDPRHNVVLEASAGTGKTSVLVRRYLNLIGAGVDPVNILAMTFTRKAAAEMRERIIAALRAAAETSDEGRIRWLQLRDRVSDIAISTIDAFCYGLLREFPLEAGLDPGFRVAEEAETARLVDEALDQALRACRRIAQDDPHVALVLARLAPGRLREGLAHLLDRRLVVRAALDRYLRGAPADLDVDGVRERATAALRTALNSVSGGLAGFLADGPIAQPRYALLSSDLRALDRGAVTDAAALAAILDEVRAYFLTQDGKPRTRAHGYKAHDAVSPDAWRRHAKALAGVAPAVQNALLAAARDLNVVLARGVRRVFTVTLERYRRTLAEHDVVDFPELIDRAVDLLRQMDEFSQSRFRLESRYHHVLVDEFQDTSRRQWDLVALLVQSWGEGFGLVHDAPLPPSLFIVGDRKQSIYRFRDANVALLDEAAETIRQLRPAGDVRRYISRSFRALPELLAFVNDVCREVAQPSDRADAFTYGEQDHFPIDESPVGPGARSPEPGARPNPGAWNLEPGARPPAFPSVRETPLGLIASDELDACAALVAGEIARLLASGTVRDRETGVPRDVGPGDIAILFRSRESHREFERALEARGIPTYVYKGLGFYDSDEIKDCVSLIRFLAAPESELRAAALLRSRFVRLSDRALKVLAGSLSMALTAEQPPAAIDQLEDEDSRVLQQARRSVASWLALVDRWRPAEVLDHVLASSAYALELGGPRAAQARENVKKLRALARRIDNRGYGTMARLAAHIDRLSVGDEANAVLEANDAVNLMTVHASKGLEFPVVFLVNVGRGVARRKPAVRVRTDPATDAAWVGIDAFQSEADALEPGGEREETKRLLYVALTRARDRLYLSAVLKDGELRAGPGSLGSVLPASLTSLFAHAGAAGGDEHVLWHGASRVHELRVARSPDGTAAVSRAGDGAIEGGQGVRARTLSPGTPETVGPANLAREATGAAAPSWPRVAATAHLRDDLPIDGEPVEADADARLVGRLVHRLFQEYAGSPLEAAPSIDRAIDRAARLLRPDERAETVDASDVCARGVALFVRFRAQPVLLDALASGAARFEVPISIVDRERHRIGRAVLDCLVTRPDGSLLVIELKTGRPRPRDRDQLDLYVWAARALRSAPDATGLLIYA